MKGLKVNMISCVLLVVVLVLVIVCCAKQTKEDFGSLTLPQRVLATTMICPGIEWNNNKNQVKDRDRRRYINCLAEWLLKKGMQKLEAGKVEEAKLFNVQNMGKCLQDGGVNMKGNYPETSKGTWGDRALNGNISIRTHSPSQYSINPYEVKGWRRRSTIECLENLIP
jgi:hypothetical protein